MVLDFLAVDNFDFTRKIVKKNLVEKLVKIEFLDKNLTFRIVCILMKNLSFFILNHKEIFLRTTVIQLEMTFNFVSFSLSFFLVGKWHRFLQNSSCW